eukprot:11171021-Lingulodinium_polyedra.AAC.1
MTVDGHAKGCIDRKLLLEVMTGNRRYEHPVKDFRPKEPLRHHHALLIRRPPRQGTLIAWGRAFGLTQTRGNAAIQRE